jgi:hypothetical protein
MATMLVAPDTNYIVPANVIPLPDGLGPWYLRMSKEPFTIGEEYPAQLITKDTAFSFYGILPFVLETKNNDEYEVVITKKEVAPPHIPDTTFYDDRNGAIVYSLGWRGGNHTTLNWYNDTGWWSNTAGSKATLNFIGTGVAVYGEQKISSHGEVGFILDGGPQVVWDMGGSDEGMDYKVRHKPSFIKTGLVDGPHTLEIIVLENRYGFIDLIQTWR